MEPQHLIVKGDELKVRYNSVYGDENTFIGEVIDVEYLSNGDLSMTEVSLRTDAAGDDYTDRRVTFMDGVPQYVENKNGARWNRLSSDMDVDEAAISRDV